jgi:hypothetical protein
VTDLAVATELAHTLRELSSGEIVTVVSNPTDRPGGERWTISAYGERYDTMHTRNAAFTLESWRSKLTAGGVRALSETELAKAHRAVLFRTIDGSWAVMTQAMSGTPDMGGWTLEFRDTDDTAEAMKCADIVMAGSGYGRLFAWMPIPNRMYNFVTVIQEV